MLYARMCSICGCGFNEGYVYDSGTAYYCSDKCLQRHYTTKEWNETVDHSDGESYYTEWEEEIDYQYFEVKITDKVIAMLEIDAEPNEFFRSYIIDGDVYAVSFSWPSNSCRVYKNEQLISDEKISNLI